MHLPERVEKEKRGPGAEPTDVQPGRDSQEERFPARRERAQHRSGRARGRKTLGRGPREKRQHSAWQLEGVLNTGNFLPSCNHVNKESGHRGTELSRPNAKHVPYIVYMFFLATGEEALFYPRFKFKVNEAQRND